MSEQEVGLDEFVESNPEMKAEALSRKTVCGIPPSDWSVVRLGEVVRIVSGNSLPTEYQDEINGMHPVYKVSDMNESGNQKYVSTVNNRLSKEHLDELNHTLYPEKTTILPKVGATLLTNKRRMLTEPSSFDNNVMGWIPDDINPEFLYYVSCTVDMEAVAQKGAVPSISKAIAQSLKIPAPPTGEQHKIASVLCNVDQAIHTTGEIIRQIYDVKKGVMQDVFHGKHRAHNQYISTPVGKVPKHWDVVSIGDVVQSAEYGLSESLSGEGQYPVFRMNNIENGYMVEEPMKYIDLTDEEFEKYRVEEGDILFNRTNSLELVGKTGIYQLVGDHVFASYLVRLQTNAKADSYYLNYYMNSAEAQNRMMDFATKGVSQANINANSIQQVKLPLPPIDEQRQIANRIRSIDEQIETNERYKSQLQSLKQGLMQDLLSGKVRTTDTNIEVLPEVAAHG